MLDDAEAIRRADVHGMMDIYLRFPDNMLDALSRAEGLVLPTKVRLKHGSIDYTVSPSHVIVAGMGGSAIGGDLLKDLLRDELEIPVEVCRDYSLPAFAGPGSLVVAVSYSGNTEETLSAFSEALQRKCMVMAITSGGLLGDVCDELGLPCVRVPRGLPPRAALPYLFTPLLALLEAKGLISGVRGRVEEAAHLLRSLVEELGPDAPTAENEAKKLASELVGTIPVVYGFGIFRSVAYRMKTQFNENSKVPSFSNWFPALNHDEVVGWEGEEALTKRISVVLLRDEDEPPGIRRRIELTKEVALCKASKVLEVWARGPSRLCKMLSVLYVGELASLYLAFARGVDPYRTRSIDAVKAGMAELRIAERAIERIKALSP